MDKRVDVAVTNAFNGVKPGLTTMGLKENGVDAALDEHNAKLVTAEMRNKLAQARADIISGKIKVVDYMAANRCS
jgi:basic membrane protein A